MNLSLFRKTALLPLVLWATLPAPATASDELSVSDPAFPTTVTVQPEGFRLSFGDSRAGVGLPAHSVAGLLLNGRPASVRQVLVPGRFLVATATEEATVTVTCEKATARITVTPARPGPQSITLQTGGGALAYGLGDSGSYGGRLNLVRSPAATYPILHDGEEKRWLTTFVVFPGRQAAGVFFAEGEKSVILGPDVHGMTIRREGPATFLLFAGTMEDIYAAYREARQREGLPDLRPKITLFELGWESWDALGWNANSRTVKDFLSRYLKEGYPIRWAVTGSGFWIPGGTTTSFGKFGPSFADHREFKSWLHENGIAWLVGQRTNFVPSGGPFYPATAKRNEDQRTNEYLGNPLSDIGLARDYFVRDDKNQPLTVVSNIFPQVPCYMLDGRNPAASQWFAECFRLWDVDGIKEDTMMRLGSRIDIFNGPISAIDRDGFLVMARCGSFSSPGTLLRVNDTYGAINMSLRTPINYLQYGASAAPNVYSDTIGFRDMNNVGATMRHAWLCALTAGMALGAYPEKWTEAERAMLKKAVHFHHRLVPYLYDAALKAHTTGYPYTLTPLGIAYPHDPAAAEPAHFQWMVGESLLAVPLLKNFRSGRLSIYLPEGVWMDYETGEKYVGPRELTDFAMPLDKTPCFVGGKGILVLRDSSDTALQARVFPVQTRPVTLAFHHPDGQKTSTVKVSPWAGSPVVTDTTTGRKVTVTIDPVTGAAEFPLLPNHHYTLTGTRP